MSGERMRRAKARTIALALSAMVMASLVFPTAGLAITRTEVMNRAQSWVNLRVPYSQTRYYQGYRTDCSGYVSMAWKLGRSLTTWSLDDVSTRLYWKSDMRPGDMLLMRTSTRGHAVVFGGWANSTRTSYYAYEMGRNGATRRVTPYPYWSSYGTTGWKVYRYKGITN